MRLMCGLDPRLVRIRRQYPLCAVIRPRQTGGNKQIAVDGRISIVADAGCALHVRETDTTTLSDECQKPCQANRVVPACCVCSFRRDRLRIVPETLVTAFRRDV